jgi:RNA polymerase sigma-70 factor (ECF subfamily)
MRPRDPNRQGADDRPPPSLSTDSSLLRRIRRGNQDAATELYYRYAHRLRALVRARCSTELARRIEPDDIVQSVFRRFFARVVQGDYDVPAGEELWGLFLVIALNRIRAAELYHRAGKRDVRHSVELGDAALEQQQAAGSQDEADFNVLQMTVRETLEGMTPLQRQIVELRVEGYEVAEIAERTARSKRTVERNLQEIRTRLRTCLETADDVPPPPA